MLELGGAGPVRGHGRPAVAPHPGPPVAHRDHRLDREGHADLDRLVETRVVVVTDLQIGVELLADPVADEVAHHAEPLGFGVILDRLADGVDRVARHRGGDAEGGAVAGDLHQFTRALVDVADEERGVGVAVHALLPQGDVAVEDVAVLQGTVVGDAVADHLVGRGAQRLGERVRAARIHQRARVGVVGDRPGVTELVDGLGGDPRSDHGPERLEGVGGESPGATHLLDRLGRLHVGLVPAFDAGAVGPHRMRDRPRHLTARADRARTDRLGRVLVAPLVLLAAAAPARVVGLGKNSHRLSLRPGGGPRSGGAHAAPSTRTWLRPPCFAS